jgi:hypothetical protein
VWRWRWWIWGLGMTLWTVALLYPEVPPVGLENTEELLTIRAFIGKTVHVSAYVVLTCLTGWLRAPARYRWLLLFVLMAHATATELGQWGMETMGISARHGQLKDVAFDDLGILIGLLLTWRWWTEAK